MKRIVALFMATFMMLLMAPVAVQAASENVTMTVTADKSEAISGDTVNFTVSVGAVQSLGGLEFTLSVPSGLTISESSIVIPDGVATTLDSDGDIVVPTSVNGYKWSYSAQDTGYSGTSDLTVLTFACTVDSDSALEDKSVTINVTDCFDNTPELNDHTTSVVAATVTVKKAPVAVTGVTLDKTSLSLKDGETANLIATVEPSDADNQTVTWSSSNAEVATVENGTVTAVKAGTATITVTTEDGSKTATCEITVACSHALTKTEAKEATCGKPGNIEYYTCSKCATTFTDEAGTSEVTLTEVPATGAHTQETRNAVAATEEATGYTGDIYCSVCDTKLATGSVIAKLPHTHSMVHKEAVAPTCETTGRVEYYACSKCSKKYSDMAGTSELTNVTVAATGHKTSTWSSNEETHWKECEVCSKKVSEVAHKYQWITDKEATLYATGIKHEECECGVKRNENTAIPKLTHTHTDITYHAAVAATCSKAGTVEYWTCGHSYCAGKYYSDEECKNVISDVVVAIAPDNHVYDDAADAICNECKYQRFYQVIDGANETYVKDSEDGLVIRVDGEYALFDSVKVDGQTVAAINYDVKAGSTIITFKSAYLDALSSDVHNVEVLYKDGKSATAQFTIEDEEEEDDDEVSDGIITGENSTEEKTTEMPRSPKTGESRIMNDLIWILVCLGLGYFVMTKKRTVH